MSKQDRQGVRTVNGLEQKYQFGKEFSNQKKTNAKQDLTLAQFISLTTSNMEATDKKISTLESGMTASEKDIVQLIEDMKGVVKKSGDVMSGDLLMSGKRVKDVATPLDSGDVANKAYADRKVSKAGDIMEGDLNMGNFRLTGLGDPQEDTDAVSKGYVDANGGSTNFVKLWQNASPNSSFGETTVSLDLSGYDAVLIYFSIYNGSATYAAYDLSMITKVGKNGYVSCNAETGSYPTNRGYTVTTTGVAFKQAYYIKSIGGSLNWSTNLLRPLEIYGIKGFTTEINE